MLLHFPDGRPIGRFRSRVRSIFAHTPDDVAEFRHRVSTGCALEPGARWDVTSACRATRGGCRCARRDAVLHGVLERQAAAVIDRLPVATSAASAVTDLLDAEDAAASRHAEIESVASAPARDTVAAHRIRQRRLAAGRASLSEGARRLAEKAAAETPSHSVRLRCRSVGSPTCSASPGPAPFHRAFKRW